MTYYEYWFIFAACVIGWITWDTRRASLGYFTQWKMQLDKDHGLKDYDVQPVTWARDAEDFEAHCRYVDRVMGEELKSFPITEPRTQ